jgi:hypothetical protein
VRIHHRPCRASPYVPEWSRMPRGLATGVDFGVTQWPLQRGKLAPLKDRFFGRNRPSPEQRTVTVITVAISASAVNRGWLGGAAAGRGAWSAVQATKFFHALIAHDHLNREGFTP